MTEEQFATWALRICLTVFIAFLGFIILFLVLGLGIAGFLLKNILVQMMM